MPIGHSAQRVVEEYCLRHSYVRLDTSCLFAAQKRTLMRELISMSLEREMFMSQLCVGGYAKDNYFVGLDTRSYHCFRETLKYVLYGSTNKLTDERTLEPLDLCHTCTSSYATRIK